MQLLFLRKPLQNGLKRLGRLCESALLKSPKPSFVRLYRVGKRWALWRGRRGRPELGCPPYDRARWRRCRFPFRGTGGSPSLLGHEGWSRVDARRNASVTGRIERSVKGRGGATLTKASLVVKRPAGRLRLGLAVKMRHRYNRSTHLSQALRLSVSLQALVISPLVGPEHKFHWATAHICGPAASLRRAY